MLSFEVGESVSGAICNSVWAASSWVGRIHFDSAGPGLAVSIEQKQATKNGIWSFIEGLRSADGVVLIVIKEQ